MLSMQNWCIFTIVFTIDIMIGVLFSEKKNARILIIIFLSKLLILN